MNGRERANQERGDACQDHRLTVRKVTVAGVVGLVVFGSIAGLFCGLVYLTARSRLPGGWLVRGLVFGLFLLVPIGIIIIASCRSDFALTSPTLILAIFRGMILIDGLATAWVIERLGRDYLPLHGLALPDTPSSA